MVGGREQPRRVEPNGARLGWVSNGSWRGSEMAAQRRSAGHLLLAEITISRTEIAIAKKNSYLNLSYLFNGRGRAVLNKKHQEILVAQSGKRRCPQATPPFAAHTTTKNGTPAHDPWQLCSFAALQTLMSGHRSLPVSCCSSCLWTESLRSRYHCCHPSEASSDRPAHQYLVNMYPSIGPQSLYTLV